MLDQKDFLTISLDKANKTHQGECAFQFFLSKMKYIWALILFIFLFDIVFHFSPMWRLSLIGVFAASILFYFSVIIYLYSFRKFSDERVARMLEEKDKSLGSKLINMLQLRKQFRDNSLSEVSRGLALEAINQSESTIKSFELNKLMVSKTKKKDVRYALMFLVLFIGLAGYFSSITKLELMRFFDPFGDHPPFSLTTLKITEPNSNGFEVLYGDSLVVSSVAIGHKPDEVFLSYHPVGDESSIITLPMFDKGDVGFSQKIENIETHLFIFTHTKDMRSVSHKRSVKVKLVPQFKDAKVKIVPPEYTQIDAREKEYDFRNLKILRGTKLDFTLSSNRPLNSGKIHYLGHSANERILTMNKVGDKDVMGWLIPNENGPIEFKLIDTDLIESKALMKGSISLFEDQGPEIAITHPENNSFVTNDFKLNAKISASDDYGIKEIRVHRALNGNFSLPKVYSYSDSPTRMEESVLFDIKDLGVQPGDVISFYAEVIDTYPSQPHLSSTDLVNLIVVSVENYNNFLRERSEIEDVKGKYDQLVKKLEDHIKEQEKLNKEIEALQDKIKNGKSGDNKKLKAELNKKIAEQNELNEKLKKIASEFENIGREDPLYDIEKEFSKQLKEQAQKIREAIEKNSEELQKFSESIDNPDSNPLDGLEGLKKAGKKLAEELKQEKKEAEQVVTQTIEEMQLMQQLVHDVNFVKMLYDQQNLIMLKSKSFDRIEDLSKNDQLSLKSLARSQRDVSKNLLEAVERLRAHAKEAENVFPKAAESARDLANGIERLQLSQNAEKAAQYMLIPHGKNSYQMAKRVQEDFFTLFEEPCMGNSQCFKNEFDNYLKLMMEMNAENTFQQMCKSLKMGNSNGQGMGGSGQGVAGSGSTGGYSNMPSMGVLGNEKFYNTGDSNKKGSGQGENNRSEGQDDMSSIDDLKLTKEINLKGVESKKQKTSKVTSQNVVEEYSQIIDAYFEKVTK